MTVVNLLLYKNENVALKIVFCYQQTARITNKMQNSENVELKVTENDTEDYDDDVSSFVRNTKRKI